MVICTSLMGHASVRPSVGVQSVKASDGATGKFVRCVCWGFQQLHGMPIGQLSWHVVTKYWPSLSWWAASRQATLLLPTKAMLLVVSMQARTALSTSQELSATLVQCDEMHIIHMLNNFWTLTWSQLESQINEVWGSCQCFVQIWDCGKIVSTHQHNIELWCMMQWAICPTAEHNSCIMKAFKFMQWCFSRRSAEAAGAFASPKQEQGHWKSRDAFKAFQGDKSQQESKR